MLLLHKTKTRAYQTGLTNRRIGASLLQHVILLDGTTPATRINVVQQEACDDATFRKHESSNRYVCLVCQLKYICLGVFLFLLLRRSDVSFTNSLAPHLVILVAASRVILSTFGDPTVGTPSQCHRELQSFEEYP